MAYKRTCIGTSGKASASVRQRDAEIDKQELGEMSLEQLVELVKRGGKE